MDLEHVRNLAQQLREPGEELGSAIDRAFDIVFKEYTSSRDFLLNGGSDRIAKVMEEEWRAAAHRRDA